MSELKEKILDHDYDGIREYDNPLPGWWLTTFYGTIIFAFLYVGYYHFGPGPAPEKVLAEDLAELAGKDKAAQGADPGPTEELLASIAKDAGHREEGRKIYLEKCSSCHGADGGGLIGPNLTDAYWIHGKGKLLDMEKVIAEGVLDKGMPQWKLLLKKDEIYNVTAYIKTLQGTHPANGKPPQGEKVGN